MDEKWHLLSFTYDQNVGGALTVDDNSVIGPHIGSFTKINIGGLFYIGGTANGVRVDLLDDMVG